MNQVDGWYLAGASGAEGPHSAEELRRRLASGELTLDWSVWREGWSEWRPLRSIPDFAAPPPPPSPPSLQSASSKSGDPEFHDFLHDDGGYAGGAPPPAGPASAAPPFAPVRGIIANTIVFLLFVIAAGFAVGYLSPELVALSSNENLAHHVAPVSAPPPALPWTDSPAAPSDPIVYLDPDSAPQSSPSLIAKPFLYRIEGGRPSWLFGTIHVSDERVGALPSSVTAAEESAEVVLTEIPMDMASQLAAMGSFMLTDGRTLMDILPPDLLRRVDAFFKARGASLEPFAQFKVWALMTQLPRVEESWRSMEEMKQRLKDDGGEGFGMLETPSEMPLDMRIYSNAVDRGKRVGGLETLEEQLAFFEALTEKEQVELLRQSLDQLEAAEAKGKSAIEAMIEAYLSGSEDLVWRLSFESLKPGDRLGERFRQVMVFDRNERMAKRIAERLRANPGRSHFFALGTLHLAGARGIPELLRKNGFSVKRVGGDS